MKRNRSIDAVRAIACIFVLFVHCPLPGQTGVYVSSLARFAVPFFLMVSGYYALRPTREKTLEAARRRMAETAKLTLAGTALYAVSNTLRCLFTGQDAFSWLGSLLNPTGMLRFFIFNRAVFLSSVMYYLFMLLYVYALFMLFVRTGTLRAACLAASVLLAAGVVMNEFLGMPWYWTGNFLLTGLPFFLMGYGIAERRPRFAHAHWLILPALLFACAETQLNKEIYCGIGSVTAGVCIVLTCLRCPQARLPKALVHFGRGGSTALFLIHCAVRDHLQMLVPAFPGREWLFPLIVLLVSIVLSLPAAALADRRTVR